MYKGTHEGYVIKGDMRISTADSPEHPNTNEHYLAYCEWLAAGNTPEPAVRLPFADRRAQRIREIDALSKAYRDAIVADISPAEMASWPIKRAEALAWQQSEDANDAPNLSMEADARDCSLADLVARVLAKSVALSAIEAQIAGHTGKLQDQIRAVEEGDSTTLAAIDINAGWPEVGA